MTHRASGLAVLAMTGLPAVAAMQAPPSQPAPVTQPAAAQQPAPPAPAAPAIAPLGEDRRISADDIDKYLADGKTLFLDVREPKELEELGTIEGAVNIPLGQLEQRLAEVPKDRLILTA
jgi:3-mercaptopyruvate sulfurtransferase SseA